MTIQKRRSIIRPEVIEAKIGLQGEVILIRPPSSLFLCVFFLVSLFCIFLFLSWSEFTKTTRVAGVLKNPAGITKVLPRQSGVIDKLYVKEGQHVKKGEKLYQVRTEQNNIAGSISNQVNKSLLQSLKLVQEKISFQEKLNALESAEVDCTIKQFNLDALHLIDEIALQKEYLEILANELAEIETLYKKKQITKVEYNGKYAQFLEKRIAVKSLKKRHQDLLNQVDNADHNRQNLNIRGKSLIISYQQKVVDLKRQISDSDAKEAYIILAPHDGIISNIYYSDGHFAVMGKILMNILPELSDLIAEIYIPTSAIGLVEVGQSIQVRYHAFPYQKFGFFDGDIESISKTLIEPNQAVSSNLIDVPVYRARVRLNTQIINVKNKRIRLQPGMTLNADVQGETRNLVSWFFEPFSDVTRG